MTGRGSARRARAEPGIHRDDRLRVLLTRRSSSANSDFIAQASSGSRAIRYLDHLGCEISDPLAYWTSPSVLYDCMNGVNALTRNRRGARETRGLRNRRHHATRS